MSLLRVCLLLFYPKATIFQLYHGTDMMYEMRRRKPEPIFSLTQGIFNLSHHIGMIWNELAFDDYTQRGNGLDTAKCYSCDRDPYPCPQGLLLYTITKWAISQRPLLREHTHYVRVIVMVNITKIINKIPISSQMYLHKILLLWEIVLKLVNTYTQISIKS